MNTVFILVTWDEGMPRTRQYEDMDDAIEALKDARPYFVAHLFQCNPDGSCTKIEGW